MRLLLWSICFSLLTYGCIRDRPDLREFAADYVRSVYQDSDFHRQYMPSAQDDFSASRANMTDEFVITGCEYYGSGAYSYGVRFSNGARGIVDIYEKEGRIISAGIIVPPPRDAAGG